MAATVVTIREVIPDVNGTIDWSSQVLQATGSGVRPPDAISAAQARQMAKRAAVADAYRNMAQHIDEVHVTGDTTVKRFITTNDTIRLGVESYIRGARVVSEKEDPDGTYTVTLQAGMAGKGGLAGVILPQVLSAQPAAPKIEVEPETPNEPAEPALLEPDLLTPPGARGPFTSLIVDTRGFNVQPAMSPRIYDADGTEICGTMSIDPEAAEDMGIAGYMGTIRAATGIRRAGRRPLVVRAIGTPDVFHHYVTLSSANAERVMAENSRTRFLEQCAVILVVDERRARDEAR